jgi:membrane-bound metal-dependent hydrolase YbcI (DUF457 family)
VFIGHFALGFAAKRAAPRASLAVLFGAAQFADLLWPVLLAFGVEQVRIDPGNTAFTPLDFVSYPYSHSLLMLGVWGALFALVFRAPSRPRRALLLAALVVSHWVLDFVTHRPDMPLYPGGSKVGLGLWNSVPLTIAVEVPMFVLGLWIYCRATKPRDARGRWGFGALAAALVAIYIANIVSPPPSTIPALAVSVLVGFVVLVAWSWWADRHREAILRTR